MKDNQIQELAGARKFSQTAIIISIVS